MSKTVRYHQHGRPSVVLHVVKENADGTFDLAYKANGSPVIEGIRLSEEPGHGNAVPIADGEELPKSAAKKAAKKAAKPKSGSQPEEPPASTQEEDDEEDEDEDPAPSTGNGGDPPPEE